MTAFFKLAMILPIFCIISCKATNAPQNSSSIKKSHFKVHFENPKKNFGDKKYLEGLTLNSKTGELESIDGFSILKFPVNTTLWKNDIVSLHLLEPLPNTNKGKNIVIVNEAGDLVDCPVAFQRIGD